MKLYGSYTSPYVRHVRVVLQHQNQPFEFIETDYAQSAKLSPLAKVPALVDQGQMYTDSSSILKYIREKQAQAYLATANELDLYAMCNTVMDSTINVFFLELSGIDINENSYLQRQLNRIDTGVAEIEKRVAARIHEVNADTVMLNDDLLRIACFISWAEFRQKVSFAQHSNCQKLLESAMLNEVFQQTAPA